MAGKNGGKREGSGRKLTGRRKVNFYITEAEEVVLKNLIIKIRSENTLPKTEDDGQIIMFETENEPPKEELCNKCGTEKVWIPSRMDKSKKFLGCPNFYNHKK